MDMLITVLLIVGGILYKIYDNYQKEMESSKRRMDQVRRQMQDQQSTPSPEHEARRPAVVQKESRKVQMEPASYQREALPEEVRQLQQKKLERQKLQQKLERQAALQDHTKVEHPEFDLRKAVIQQAILERPYQY